MKIPLEVVTSSRSLSELTLSGIWLMSKTWLSKLLLKKNWPSIVHVYCAVVQLTINLIPSVQSILTVDRSKWRAHFVPVVMIFDRRWKLTNFHNFSTIKGTPSFISNLMNTFCFVTDIVCFWLHYKFGRFLLNFITPFYIL